MADVRHLKDRAAELLARGRFARAAGKLAEAVRLDPGDVALRQRWAEALARSGDQAAVGVYADAAERWARAGQPVKAIALCRVVLDLEPGHLAVRARLAQLCARRQPAPRPSTAPGGGEGAPTTSTGITLPLAAPDLVPEPLAADVSAAGPGQAPAAFVPEPLPLSPWPGPAHAAPTAAAEPGALETPLSDLAAPPAPAIPRLPLFCDLGEEAFVALAGRLALRLAEPGETVVRQGEPGGSVFALASGQVRVERSGPEGTTVLAHLGEGAFFGEMALLAGTPRAASVVAESPCQLVEIGADVLAELGQRHPEIPSALRQMRRERLLANALATSPVFQPFGPADREALLARFEEVEAEAGAPLVREGVRSDGLYVVLAGALAVTRRAPGGDALAARLEAGDVFGEMSCLRKAGATATVTPLGHATLLRLPRAAFDEVVMTHPQVLEVVAGLADERRERIEGV